MHNYLPFSMSVECIYGGNKLLVAVSHFPNIWRWQCNDVASIRLFGVKWAAIFMTLCECNCIREGCIIPVVEFSLPSHDETFHVIDLIIRLPHYHSKNNNTMRDNYEKSWRLSFIVTFVQWQCISHTLF